MTTLYINNTEADLDADTTIALTFQVNDVGDVPSRQGNYSNKFKLPLTSKNKQLLGFANVVASAQEQPYRRIPAMLSIGSVKTYEGFIVIESVADTAEVVFYAGNTPFFSAIDKLKLNDLNFDDLNHQWKMETAYASINNTEGYIWPVINWFESDKPQDYDKNFYINYARPCVFVSTIIKKIAQQVGYTVGGSFTNSYEFNNEVLPITTENFRWSPQRTEMAKFKATTDGYIIPFNNASLVYLRLNPVLNSQNFHSPYYYKVPAFGNGNINIKLNLDLRLLPSSNFLEYVNRSYIVKIYRKSEAGNDYVIGTCSIILEKNVNQSWYCSYGTNENTESMAVQPNIFFTIPIKIDGVGAVGGNLFWAEISPLGFSMGNLLGSFQVLNTSTFEVEYAEPPMVTYGDLIELTSQMPNIACKDFIKALAVRYALLIDTDEETKTLNLYRFDEIIENSNTVLNWTNKLHVAEPPEIEFRPDGYGQLNWLGYANQQPDYTNPAQLIAVPDTTLKLYGDEYKQPFYTSNSDNYWGNSLANIPAFVSESTNSAELFTYKNPELRLLMLKRMPVNPTNIAYAEVLTIYINYAIANQLRLTTPVTQNTLPFAYFFDDSQPHSLSFDTLIPKHYKALKTLLNNYKKVTCWLNLLPTDIANLNFLQPVAIEPLGSQFYVNKIQNYTPGKLTKVELVRL